MCIDQIGGVPGRERGSLEWETYAFSFAHRLLTLRKARGLSQEELAHRCGMHRNAVSNLERATANREPFVSDPQLSTVYRLAKALNVPPVHLLPDATISLTTRSTEQETLGAMSVVEKDLHAMIAAETAAAAKTTPSRRRSGPTGSSAATTSPAEN